MPQVVTISQAVERARADGLAVSEYALRRWVKQGKVPVRRVGTKALLYYPALVRFVTCEDGGDNPAPAASSASGPVRLWREDKKQD